MIDLRQLEQFLALSQHLHFGRASRELGMGQPALSKSIQRLEESLGAKLLDRSRRSVRLTPVGQAVAQRAQRLMAECEDLEREVSLLVDGEIGGINIGLGPAMGESYLATAIARIAQAHPRARIIVRSDHWQQLTEWLFDGHLDIFTADVTDLDGDERLNIVRLPSEKFVWFCRSEHPLAGKKRVTRSDLLEFPLATPRMPPWAVTWFAEADEDGSRAINGSYGTIECESYSVLKRMVLASDCISAALHSTIADELSSGALVRLPIKSPSIKTNAGIVRIASRTLSPLADAFVTEVLELSKQTTS